MGAGEATRHVACGVLRVGCEVARRAGHDCGNKELSAPGLNRRAALLNPMEPPGDRPAGVEVGMQHGPVNDKRCVYNTDRGHVRRAIAM